MCGQWVSINVAHVYAWMEQGTDQFSEDDFTSIDVRATSCIIKGDFPSLIAEEDPRGLAMSSSGAERVVMAMFFMPQLHCPEAHLLRWVLYLAAA